MFLAHEIFWQFVVEGVLAPGMDTNNLKLPWFHITKYGRDVLATVPDSTRVRNVFLDSAASVGSSFVAG